jgi:hypothetical protein
MAPGSNVLGLPPLILCRFYVKIHFSFFRYLPYFRLICFLFVYLFILT